MRPDRQNLVIYRRFKPHVHNSRRLEEVESNGTDCGVEPGGRLQHGKEQMVNGCSELRAQLLGRLGQHTAIGVSGILVHLGEFNEGRRVFEELLMNLKDDERGTARVLHNLAWRDKMQNADGPPEKRIE